jgi:hypothetical protein
MRKVTTLFLIGALAASSVSCTTTYDTYGNPRQAVDPGTAVAGAAAVGILGYAIANKRNDNRANNSYRPGYHDRNNRRRGYHDRYDRYHRR